jgi:calcineurin-like phosphoesterase family protein
MPTEHFTADQHYFHGKVIEYCSRPFKNTKEMHKALISNHNSVVGEHDTVWNIGDIAMLEDKEISKLGPLLKQFNGIQHLVLGNHEDGRPFTYVKFGFTSVHTSMWFERHGYTFVLAHDPSIYTIVQNMGPKTYMLCGHIHELFQHLLPEKRVINVGVDVWDYAPVSLQTILELIKEHEDDLPA